MAGSGSDAGGLVEAMTRCELQSHRRLMTASGPDALRWLQGMVTQDVQVHGLAVAVYALVLSPQGKILADMWCYAPSDDRILMSVPAEQVSALTDHFHKHIVMEDVAISTSQDLAIAIFATPPPAIPPAVFTECSGTLLGFDAGRQHSHVGLPAAMLTQFHSALGSAGIEVLSADDPRANASRIERGEPRWGVDFTEDNYPQEAGLESSAVSFKKGCYVGQEVVVKLEHRGQVSRRLVKLAWPAGVPPAAPGSELRSSTGRATGIVTSAAADCGGTAKAFAFVSRSDAQAGQAVLSATGPAVMSLL